MAEFKGDPKIIDGVEFVPVCKVDDVFEGKGIRIAFEDDQDMQVAIIKKDGEFHCLSNVCPHRHKDKIYQGIIRGDRIMCPEHGWTYSIETGQNVNKKQGLKSLNKYEIFEEDGIVYIEKPWKEIPRWRRE